MDTCAISDEDQLSRLRIEFPGHRIWRAVRKDGVSGDWVATLHDPSAGVDPTVIEDTADGLRDTLRLERARARRGEKGM